MYRSNDFPYIPTWDEAMQRGATERPTALDDYRTLIVASCNRDIRNGTLVIDETVNPFEYEVTQVNEE